MRYEEGGFTGMREATLADALLESGEISIAEEGGRVQGFEEDLYDMHQRGPLVRNKAERAKFMMLSSPSILSVVYVPVCSWLRTA